MPVVDSLQTGAVTEAEWLDCQAACKLSPLPADFLALVWRNALSGEERVACGQSA